MNPLEEHREYLREVCANCGLTMGAHHGGTSPWPYNYCPGHEGRMDWENGPGTIFSPSGEYRDREIGRPAKGGPTNERA